MSHISNSYRKRRGRGDLRFEDLEIQFLDGLKMLCVTGY
jgi:hypothetical protein